MRETWNALRLIISVALRADPKRAVASLIEPLSMFCFPFTAIGLQLLTNGAINKSARDIITGACVIGGVQAVIATTALIGNELRFQLRERIGLVLDQELVKLSAEIPGLEHHERPEYQDKLELVKQDESALGFSLNALLNVLSTVCYASSTLLVLVLVHPALLFLALFAIPMIPLARLQQRWAKEGEEASAAPNRLARHLRALATDRTAGMELRVFNLHHELNARFRTAAFNGRLPVLQAQRRKLVTDIGRHVVLGIGYLGAVTLMLRRAVHGEATAGDVVATIYIGQQVTSSTVNSISSVANLGNTVRSAKRLCWLRDYARSTAAQRSGTSMPPERLAQGITFDNVSFRYPGTDRWVLRDLALTIPAGAVLAVVGDNGAGKTTLVKLLTRMYEPTEGRILIDGVNLATIDVVAWRERLAAAFQDFARFELIAQQSVGVGDLTHIDDEPTALTALERAGGSDVIRALPRQLDTQLGSTWDGGVDISTGQWQKLALGRALMRPDPLITFFDEPTASLDAPTEHALFQRYIDAAQAGAQSGAITVLVSHRFSTVRSADLIVVLDGNTVAEIGGHDELVQAGGLYAELYGLQARSYA